jgi:hypothetical protein
VRHRASVVAVLAADFTAAVPGRTGAAATESATNIRSALAKQNPMARRIKADLLMALLATPRARIGALALAFRPHEMTCPALTQNWPLVGFAASANVRVRPSAVSASAAVLGFIACRFPAQRPRANPSMTALVFVRNRKRRQGGTVRDFKLLIDVVKMNLDGTFR